MRVFHGNTVFALGPEANHHITVSHASNYSWRHGHMGDLMALLGDGLLTIDGDFHRSWRRIMPPAFHRERIEAAQATTEAETNAALAGVRAGEPLNLDAWTSELALRIAMRALFGLDRTARGAISLDAAAEFEAALGFYARDYALHRARARTPWARMQAACHRLGAPGLGEIAGRRAGGAGGEDVLSPLLDARDDAGDTLSDRHVRDEAMTLLLAGHDTTNLDRGLPLPRAGPPPRAGRGRGVRPRGGHRRHAAPVCGRLDRAAPVDRAGGDRRRRRAGGVPVSYCSWVGHHLPDAVGDAALDIRQTPAISPRGGLPVVPRPAR